VVEIELAETSPASFAFSAVKQNLCKSAKSVVTFLCLCGENDTFVEVFSMVFLR
jgi:hypothetical protein